MELTSLKLVDSLDDLKHSPKKPAPNNPSSETKEGV